MLFVASSLLSIGFLTSNTTCGDVRAAYAAPCCSQPDTDPFTAVRTLKMGIKFGSASVENKIVQYMDEAVDRLTGGRLRISLWDAVPGMASTAQLDDGTLDIAAVYTSDAVGKTILSQVLSDGMVSAGSGLDAAEMINFLVHGEGRAFHTRAYEGTAYVGHVCGQLGPEIFGWSKIEIPDLATFSGMTMRVPGGLLLQAYKLLNPNATGASPPATVAGIVKGDFDAWEWNSPYGDYNLLRANAPGFDLRISDYKHLYLAPLHQNSGIFDAVYKRTLFDSLPSDFRTALQTAATEAAFRLYFARTALNGPFVANLTAKADGWDVTIHESLPTDITTAFVRAIDTVLSDATVGDADAIAAVATMRAHSDSIRTWRSANLRGEADLYSATIDTLDAYYRDLDTPTLSGTPSLLVGFGDFPFDISDTTNPMYVADAQFYGWGDTDTWYGTVEVPLEEKWLLTDSSYDRVAGTPATYLGVHGSYQELAYNGIVTKLGMSYQEAAAFVHDAEAAKWWNGTMSGDSPTRILTMFGTVPLYRGKGGLGDTTMEVYSDYGGNPGVVDWCFTVSNHNLAQRSLERLVSVVHMHGGHVLAAEYITGNNAKYAQIFPPFNVPTNTIDALGMPEDAFYFSAAFPRSADGHDSAFLTSTDYLRVYTELASHVTMLWAVHKERAFDRDADYWGDTSYLEDNSYAD